MIFILKWDSECPALPAGSNSLIVTSGPAAGAGFAAYAGFLREHAGRARPTLRELMTGRLFWRYTLCHAGRVLTTSYFAV